LIDEKENEFVQKAKLKKDITLKGIAVSEGIAIGSICTYRTELDDIYEYQIEATQLSQELDRYYSSLTEVNMQFMAKQNRIARAIGHKHAEIYEAYRLIVEDPFFQEEIPQAIRHDKKNSESIIRSKLRVLEKRFDSIADEYLRERIYDIRGVSRRIIYNLMQTDTQCDFDSFSDNILIARELTPVDSIYFQHRALKGIATEYGGKTSHAAILAHSLEIAAIVGVKDLMKHVDSVKTAIIDGVEGNMILNPSKQTEKMYRERGADWEKRRRRYRSAIDVPSPQIFGKKVQLMANINDESEIELAQRYHAEGVGLFRTELPFIAKERFLTEDEQYEIYKKVLKAFPDHSVIIRLLDMGGDKFLPFSDDAHELNPFLGWRSIRILLSNRELFEAQLRALFRAASCGNLKIMIPMISSLEDLQSIKYVFNDVKSEMNLSDLHIPIGIMVEIPSAALEIETLLKEVDFASIGTNDLIQYTLAVDRNNEKVASYYQPLNRGVLWLIQKVISAGEKSGKNISVCGEMAGDPLYVPLLAALGIRNLSMHPAALPRVKNILLKTPDKTFEHLSKNFSRFDTVAELTDYLRSNLNYIEST
jgi:phosphotransferase system enzyme I (PtsI)